MSSTISENKKDLDDIRKNQENVYEFAIKQVEHNYKRERFIVKILTLIILLLLAINGYQSYKLSTLVVETSTYTEEYTQEGVYNFYDSEGNLVSSDLSLEEMQELIDLNKGE